MGEKITELEKLASDIINRGVCADLANNATQLVFGAGNPNADVVFIGEAPGKNEDEQGLPFVGAAGKFLNEMLASIEINRDDVYITNIVKYRPPNNRDPSDDEKAEFWPYLLKQLEIIDPKVIVTLGRHSMGYFLPNAKISSVHGRAVKKTVKHKDGKETEWLIMPLFHPAAALYNGGMRQTLLDDFQNIKQIID